MNSEVASLLWTALGLGFLGGVIAAVVLRSWLRGPHGYTGPAV